MPSPDTINKFIQDWGLVILIAYLWSVLKYGTQNRKKFERWRAWKRNQERLKK